MEKPNFNALLGLAGKGSFQPIGAGLIALAEAIVYAADRLGPAVSPPTAPTPTSGEYADLNRLEDLCDRLGLDDDSLDEAIHDLFAGKAADINNAGRDAQVYTLYQELGAAEAESLVRQVAAEDAG